MLDLPLTFRANSHRLIDLLSPSYLDVKALARLDEMEAKHRSSGGAAAAAATAATAATAAAAAACRGWTPAVNEDSAAACAEVDDANISHEDASASFLDALSSALDDAVGTRTPANVVSLQVATTASAVAAAPLLRPLTMVIYFILCTVTFRANPAYNLQFDSPPIYFILIS